MHGSDVMLKQEVHGDPDRVRGSIVLPVHMAMVPRKEEYNVEFF